MNTFIATAFLFSTIGVNFARASEALEPELEYEYNSDRKLENDLVQNISARTDVVCRPWYNQKVEAQVWLCPTNTFVEYGNEEACRYYCW